MPDLELNINQWEENMEHWMEVAIDTKPEGIDLVCSVLTAQDLSGFVIEDETDFLTFLEENKATWDYIDEDLMAQKRGISRIILYLPEDETGWEMLKTVRQTMAHLAKETPESVCGTLQITLKNMKNEDWENNWKAYYKPISVGRRFYIVPEWERDTPIPENRVPIYLNPGLIFGTGSHASTRLCLEAAESILHPGDQVLDLGSGSGILSIAALKLGAKAAVACDIDPKAEKVARENARRNDIEEERYQVETGNLLKDISLGGRVSPKTYQVIFSNIVADVIIALAPQIADFLVPRGVWIGSGIIDSRKKDVEEALLKNKFILLQEWEQDGWICFAAVQKEDNG